MAYAAEYLLSAAIDFGTTYSGYAFSLLHDYKRDPLKISANTWTAGNGGLMSLKTSTCVLFDPDGKFYSFGFEAEDKYSDLALDDKQEGWHYFRRFKMKLYDNKFLNRSFKLEDDQGRKMPAIRVFSQSIKYLKDHMMKTCKKQLTQIHQSDIRWVLTVPAIWSDASKQFMREAAERAGIDGSHLIIALEPEAASLYCRYLPLHKKGDGEVKALTAGAKYLVLDAGGGTIDITIHEVQRDGTLREIHKVNGGDWGGTKVDHAYQLLLSGIIGNGAFRTFTEQNKADMIEFYRDFEVKKRTIKPNPDSEEKVTFKIPMTMNESCKQENGNDISSIVKSRSSYMGVLSVTGDKLRVNGKQAKTLFKDPVRNIILHIRSLLKEQSAQGIGSILMVGGFSESLVLQDEIQERFPNHKIIVPQDAGLAVLKGAVIFGHEPNIIKTRVCKYTYGVNASEDFDPEIHDRSKLYTTSYGEDKCADLFSIHVCEGDSVNIGEPQIDIIYNVEEHAQTKITFEVYISKQKNPTYITDAGCTKVGTFSIDMPDISRGLDRGAKVQFTFSHTELEVQAVDKYTGAKVTAAFDCLK